MASNENRDDANIVSVLIYPSNNTSHAHLFSLSTEGVLTTSIGQGDRRVNERGQILVTADFTFELVHRTESVELTQHQLQEIIDLADMITDNDFVDERGQDGGRYFDVIYNGKVYQYADNVLDDVSMFRRYRRDIPHMRELIYMLIDYSPIFFDLDEPAWLQQS